MQFLSREHFGVLKGLAIVAVLISHVGGYSGVTWFTPLGGIGVAIFLFCSGYGLRCSFSDFELKNYWKKKIVGVYATYFVIELIAALINQRRLRTIVFDLLLLKTAHPYGWYMQYLFGCYFVFWIIYKFVDREKTRLLILGVASVISFFVFDELRAEQAFSFVGGIFSASLVSKKETEIKYGKLYALAFLLISVVLLAIKQLPAVRQQNAYVITLLNLWIKSLAAVSIIYLTYAVRIINKISKRIFPFWGRISYVFYLLHGYLIFIISANLMGNYLLNVVVFIAVSTVSAVVVNYVLEKMKGAFGKALKIR